MQNRRFRKNRFIIQQMCIILTHLPQVPEHEAKPHTDLTSVPNPELQQNPPKPLIQEKQSTTQPPPMKIEKSMEKKQQTSTDIIIMPSIAEPHKAHGMNIQSKKQIQIAPDVVMSTPGKPNPEQAKLDVTPIKKLPEMTRAREQPTQNKGSRSLLKPFEPQQKPKPSDIQVQKIQPQMSITKNSDKQSTPVNVPIQPPNQTTNQPHMHIQYAKPEVHRDQQKQINNLNKTQPESINPGQKTLDTTISIIAKVEPSQQKIRTNIDNTTIQGQSQQVSQKTLEATSEPLIDHAKNSILQSQSANESKSTLKDQWNQPDSQTSRQFAQGPIHDQTVKIPDSSQPRLQQLETTQKTSQSLLRPLSPDNQQQSQKRSSQPYSTQNKQSLGIQLTTSTQSGPQQSNNVEQPKAQTNLQPIIQEQIVEKTTKPFPIMTQQQDRFEEPIEKSPVKKQQMEIQTVQLLQPLSHPQNKTGVVKVVEQVTLQTLAQELESQKHINTNIQTNTKTNSNESDRNLQQHQHPFSGNDGVSLPAQLIDKQILEPSIPQLCPKFAHQNDITMEIEVLEEGEIQEPFEQRSKFKKPKINIPFKKWKNWITNRSNKSYKFQKQYKLVSKYLKQLCPLETQRNFNVPELIDFYEGRIKKEQKSKKI